MKIQTSVGGLNRGMKIGRETSLWRAHNYWKRKVEWRRMKGEAAEMAREKVETKERGGELVVLREDVEEVERVAKNAGSVKELGGKGVGAAEEGVGGGAPRGRGEEEEEEEADGPERVEVEKVAYATMERGGETARKVVEKGVRSVNEGTRSIELGGEGNSISREFGEINDDGLVERTTEHALGNQ